jgi:hypothetical protein
MEENNRPSRRSARLDNIPIINKTIQNINAKKPRSVTPKLAKRSVSKKKLNPKIECRTVKINGTELNSNPLLAQYCGFYAHYPIGKFNGSDEVSYQELRNIIL